MTKPSEFNGIAVPPAPGSSMRASFNQELVIPHEYIWWFHEGNRAIRVGDWKLVSEGMSSPWELYNLATDRSETTDLSASEPLRVQTLGDKWKAVLDEITTLATTPDVMTKQ